MKQLSCRTVVLLVSVVSYSEATDTISVLDSEAKGLRIATDYAVSVDGREIHVRETVKASNHGTNGVNRLSFAGFDCAGSVQVEVLVRRPFQSVELRPRNSGIKVSQDGNRLSFTLKPLQHVTLIFDDNYDNSLTISANPTHPVPERGEVQHYFGPGLHRMATRLKLDSGDRVYLAEGAIVCGAFDLKNVENVRIFGRGIVYGGETPHQENYRVFAGDNTRDVTIEGITVCNAPGWIVSFWNGSDNLTVRNVKMLGNFRYNTDGVQTGTTGLLVENCYLQCNDDNFSLNGICRDVTIRNNVLWNVYNGGVFMMGWATGEHFHLENIRVHDNTIIRCGGCCDYDRKAPFSMKLFGSQRLAKDIEFSNIEVEDIAAFGRWIDLQAGKASKSTVTNIHFKNINVHSTWLVEGEIRGSADTIVTGVTFSGISIADKLMAKPETGGLTLIQTRGTRIEGQPFADVSVATQPIPDASAHKAPHVSSQSDSLSGKSSPHRFASGPNLLMNATFAAGAEGWTLPQSGIGSVKTVKANGRSGLLIASRRDSSVGISRDITKLMLRHGPGTYSYGLVAKGVSDALHVKATLIVEDEKGTQQHPTPDALVDTKSFCTATRTQPLTWHALKKASLKIESGYGDKQDVVIYEVFLKKLPSAME